MVFSMHATAEGRPGSDSSPPDSIDNSKSTMKSVLGMRDAKKRVITELILLN